MNFSTNIYFVHKRVVHSWSLNFVSSNYQLGLWTQCFTDLNRKLMLLLSCAHSFKGKFVNEFQDSCKVNYWSVAALWVSCQYVVMLNWAFTIVVNVFPHDFMAKTLPPLYKYQCISECECLNEPWFNSLSSICIIFYFFYAFLCCPSQVN